MAQKGEYLYIYLNVTFLKKETAPIRLGAVVKHNVYLSRR